MNDVLTGVNDSVVYAIDDTERGRYVSVGVTMMNSRVEGS